MTDMPASNGGRLTWGRVADTAARAVELMKSLIVIGIILYLALLGAVDVMARIQAALL